MTSLLSLYQQADFSEITVDCFTLDSREALSVMDDNGNCFIAIDPFKLKNHADETAKLAHEMGHCITGSFYNKWATCDIRQKHELRADKWAFRRLVPRDELYSYYQHGITQPWELAEIFELPEELVRKAMAFYHEQEIK